MTVARWVITGAATAASALALDVTASAVGVLLVATHALQAAPFAVILAALAATYGLWAAGLRANVVANGQLLEATATSTNVLSKLLFDVAQRRSWSPRAARTASAVGYVMLEAAKEIPYYVGVFGSALLTDHVDAAEAFIFLADRLPVANVSDSMARMSAGGASLRPMHAGGGLAGPALTVKTRPGDNLMLHKALDLAEAGDVIVVDGGGDLTNSLMGELMLAHAETKRPRRHRPLRRRPRRGLHAIQELPRLCRRRHPPGPLQGWSWRDQRADRDRGDGDPSRRSGPRR